MNWLYAFVFLVSTIIFGLSYNLDYNIGQAVGGIQSNETLRENVVHGLVDLDLINDGYSFTGVKCLSGEKECFENNLNLFYDANKNLKLKQVVYFLNDNLTFEFKNNWYKNGDNIQELNNKVVYMVVIPGINKLGGLQGIKRLSIMLKSNKPIESEFLLSRFWLK